MDTQIKIKLRSQAQSLKPLAWIGKNGFNEGVISEIKKQLKKKHLIKIKVLKSFIDEQEIDKKEFANHVAEVLDAELIQKIGFTLVLYKK